jgi:sulfide:quinone oxidoreductase
MRFEVVIVGGGTAGVTVGARLRRAGISDIAIIDPADTHYYQPMWTLVGGGLASIERSGRPMAAAMPKGVTWIRSAVSSVHADTGQVVLADGQAVGYRILVLAAGIHLNWRRVPGLAEALGRDGVSSIYRADLAPKTWRDITSITDGTAVFTVPPGPVKCAGAGQKIAYLACDYWRQAGRDIEVHLVLPGARPFAAPAYAQLVEHAISRWGITPHFSSDITAVDHHAGKVMVRDADGFECPIAYDLLHVVPPQSAPDWIATSDVASPDGPDGFVEVDRHTLRHPRFPAVFALGDVANTPNVKTGAAIRKQAPVLVDNVLAVLSGQPLPARYDGYTCCPMVTGRDRLFLAEMDYDGPVSRNVPGWPREIRDPGMWIKRYGLPALYRLMIAGRS